MPATPPPRTLTSSRSDGTARRTDRRRAGDAAATSVRFGIGRRLWSPFRGAGIESLPLTQLVVHAVRPSSFHLELHAQRLIAATSELQGVAPRFQPQGVRPRVEVSRLAHVRAVDDYVRLPRA